MSKPLILVVEDELPQRTVLSYNLKARGFRVLETDNGKDAILLVQENMPDVVILDWMLPQTSGIEVCRQLKKTPNTKKIPIIMLSARSEENDLVRGLEIGADDYVIKPFSVAELMARIKTQLRRTRASVIGERLKFSDIELDTETYKVYRDNRQLKLGKIEFNLLSTFMEKPGRVWTRDQLLDRVWGRDIYVDTRTVDVHIGRLRKALCFFGGNDPLRTIRGVGYALG